jgi:hypothetical protein
VALCVLVRVGVGSESGEREMGSGGDWGVVRVDDSGGGDDGQAWCAIALIRRVRILLASHSGKFSMS